MPKETFFNLPEEKKNRIIEVAVDEFAEHNFNDATVSRIVKNANIAKGSFYQYFEDKYDLFRHIVDVIAAVKMMYFKPVMLTIDKDNFFDVLKNMFKAGLKFSVENKKYSDIGITLMKSTDKDFLRKIYGDYDGQINDLFTPLIKAAMKKGEINERINIEFLSYSIGQQSIHIAEFYFRNRNETVLSENYLDIVDDMLMMLRSGIEKR